MSGDLPHGSVPWFHDTARVVARYLYRPRFRIGVTGVERVPRADPLVVVANHSSFYEPQLILGALPRRCVFLVKRELFTGVAGPPLRWIGQLSIDRGAPDPAPLRACVRILRAGGAVGVFPEGTRGAGDVATAERGAAWLVRATGATVLPVAVRGTARSARRGWRPRVDLLIGEPFAPAVGAGRAGLREGTERIRGALADTVRTLDGMRAQRDGKGQP